MRRSRFSRDYIMAKLRQADVGTVQSVAAVVRETTGEISVITTQAVDDQLMADVAAFGGDGDR